MHAESFHLNGHIIGFRLQTQKLESPYKTPSSTLAVKGLRICITKMNQNSKSGNCHQIERNIEITAQKFKKKKV